MDSASAAMLQRIEASARIKIKRTSSRALRTTLVEAATLVKGSAASTKTIAVDGIPSSAKAVILQTEANNTSGSATLAIIKARCDAGAAWTVLAQTVDGSAMAGQSIVPLTRASLWKAGSAKLEISVTGACSYTVKVIGYLE